MRISTSQIFQQGITAMLNSQSAIAKTQQQLSSGQRLLSPSDDPAAASQIINLNQVIESTQQYQRNAGFAESRLQLEETLLTEAGDILQRIRELTVRSNNSTLNSDDLKTIAIEARGAHQDLLRVANSRDANGEYLFAGFQVGTEPFSVNATGSVIYNGDQGLREIQIGESRKISVGDSGETIFMRVSDGAGGISSIFDTIDEFVSNLESGTPSGNTLTKIDSEFDQILDVRASIGARLNSIDNQRNANESFNLLLNQNLSELKDLDYAEAVSRFEKQLLALQASQQSFIKIQGLSLFNYL